MTAHARLSPSSAHRWSSCPGSVRLTERLPRGEQDTTNVYSREGTLGHEVAEILSAGRLGHEDPETTQRRLDDWRARAGEFDADELIRHGQDWAGMLAEYASHGAKILLEQTVATGIPQCWGTADAVVIEKTSVKIIDLKLGRGVRVDAEDNEQLQLYGLGVLDTFAPDAETVVLTIWQPRLNHVSTVEWSADDLRQWRTAIAQPAALLALSPDAPVIPSESACRFCPVRGTCAVRTDLMLSQDFGDPETLTPAQLGDTLERLDFIEDWCTAVRAAARLQVEKPEGLPGWKLVRKAGRRHITDEQAVAEILGPEAWRMTLRPLGELERLAGGKKSFTEKLGDLVRLTQGSDVLVPESDPRPSATPMQDFTVCDTLEDA